MTDFATITGQIFEDYGVPVDQRVPWSSSVRFTPVALDESHAIVNSSRTLLAQADRDGIIHLNGGPVELWAGRWKITLPDGESFEADLKAGETYDLTDLRGFVPAPGQVVQTVKLDGVRAVALPAGAEPTATVEAGVLALGIPKGERGEPGEPGAPGKDAPGLEDTGWVDLLVTGKATLAEGMSAAGSSLYGRRVGKALSIIGSVIPDTSREGYDPSESWGTLRVLAEVTDPQFVLDVPVFRMLAFPAEQPENRTRTLSCVVMVEAPISMSLCGLVKDMDPGSPSLMQDCMNGFSFSVSGFGA